MNGNSDATREHVFGPVPSRRLGRSLGVDLVPLKVCTFDCVYCQVGRTTRKTVSRDTFVPPKMIVAEVREKLRSAPRPDYITLAGSGEPTLHAELGAIIEGIRGVTDVPVAVLTNGSLLYDPEVRRACARADLVLPSLDAGDEEVFRKINRPAPGLTLERIVAGMAAFRKEYHGAIWLEVFLVGGVNTDPTHVRKIRALVERIRPDRVHLNTAVRPTAEPEVKPVSEAELADLCKLLGPHAEVIADFQHVHEAPEFAAKAEEVLALIRRRPVTTEEIAAGLGIHVNEAAKYVTEILAKGVVTKERRGGRDYLRAV